MKFCHSGRIVIPIRPAIFENENRIAVFIPNQKDVIDLIKKVPQSRWSPTHQPWTTVLLSRFKSNGYPTNASVSAANNPLIYTNSNNGSCFGGNQSLRRFFLVNVY
jgi:hypothetical protein